MAGAKQTSGRVSNTRPAARPTAIDTQEQQFAARVVDL